MVPLCSQVESHSRSLSQHKHMLYTELDFFLAPVQTHIHTLAHTHTHSCTPHFLFTSLDISGGEVEGKCDGKQRSHKEGETLSALCFMLPGPTLIYGLVSS